jgi:hypothetical protein
MSKEYNIAEIKVYHNLPPMIFFYHFLLQMIVKILKKKITTNAHLTSSKLELFLFSYFSLIIAFCFAATRFCVIERVVWSELSKHEHELNYDCDLRYNFLIWSVAEKYCVLKIYFTIKSFRQFDGIGNIYILIC